MPQLLSAAADIVPTRNLNLLYIILDSIFIVVFLGLLVWKKRYSTVIFALFGGVLYTLVDYGGFYLLSHTRTVYIDGALADALGTFWVLLWMSMSYGITNFAWIWLWFSKDKRLLEWSLLICVWWLAAPMLAQAFGQNMPVIVIRRTTGSYHGYMALILALSYFSAIVWNLRQKDEEKRFPLLWMLAIGILVQFAWECALLLGGIRSTEISSVFDKLMTLVVNSLLETNLGAVPIFCIFCLLTARFTEDLKRRPQPLTFTGRIREINRTKVRRGSAPADGAQGAEQN